MSDFNQFDANNEAIENTDAEGKAEKELTVPTTAKHARYLRDLAIKRAEKARALAEKEDGIAAHYDELAQTLPESAPAAPKAIVVHEPGTVVHFRYGRTTATSTAKELVGVIRGRKDDENGKPLAYRIEAGEGFDADVYTVQPGAIKGTQAQVDAGAEYEPEEGSAE